MELMRPKAVLFDWDNTLVDTWPVIHEALVHCFTQMDKEPWALEEVKAKVAHSMRDYFPKLFGERWEEAGQHYLDGYRNIHCERLLPMEGAEEVLQALQAAGVYQAVVSNKKGPTLRIEADHLNWTPYFNAVVGADDAAHDKPHADHALMALADYSHPHNHEVWFIGDNAVDMEMAKNAGLAAIFYGPQEKADAVPHPIHARVENHQELAELLSRYLQLAA